MKTLFILGFFFISFLAIEMPAKLEVVNAPKEYLSGPERRRNRRKSKKS